MNRRAIYLVGLSILLLMSAFLGRYLILGGISIVRLKVDPISSAVALNIKNPTTGYAPVEGLDYTLGQIKYFDNNSWVVVSIDPVGASLDPGELVFKTTGNTYQKVLGPSNFFQSKDLDGIPPDVAGYLEAER